MASKSKSGDIGNWDIPKRKRKMLPLSEKVNVLNKERKRLYGEVAKI